MLGRRFNSSMSLVTGSAYSNILVLGLWTLVLVGTSSPKTKDQRPNWLLNNIPTLTQQSAQSRRQHAAKLTLHCFVNFPIGFVNGGQDHVLKHLDVAFFDCLGINLQRDNFMIALHLHGHDAAAR